MEADSSGVAKPDSIGDGLNSEESKKRIDALSDETRRAVIGLLYANGPMFHRDLAKRLDLKTNELSYHLNLLVKAGYVARSYAPIRIGKSFSRYSITDLGVRFLDFIGAKPSLDQTIKPTPPKHDYQEGPMNIIESYVSPWALPKERIMGWVRWQPGQSIQTISLSADEHLLFTKLLDARTQVVEPTKAVEIKPSQLEVAGFIGFIAKFDWIPESEKNVQIRVEFHGEHTSLVTLDTRIVRPILEIVQMTPKRIRIGPNNKPVKELKVLIQNKSQAEAIGLTIDLNASVSSSGPVTLVKQDASALERTPNLLVSLSDFPTKIKIRKQGVAKLGFVFRFKDRVGNEYSVSSPVITIRIERVVQQEIPISNVFRGEQSDVTLAPLLTVSRSR